MALDSKLLEEMCEFSECAPKYYVDKDDNKTLELLDSFKNNLEQYSTEPDPSLESEIENIYAQLQDKLLKDYYSKLNWEARLAKMGINQQNSISNIADDPVYDEMYKPTPDIVSDNTSESNESTVPAEAVNPYIKPIAIGAAALVVMFICVANDVTQSFLGLLFALVVTATFIISVLLVKGQKEEDDYNSFTKRLKHLPVTELENELNKYYKLASEYTIKMNATKGSKSDSASLKRSSSIRYGNAVRDEIKKRTGIEYEDVERVSLLAWMDCGMPIAAKSGNSSVIKNAAVGGVIAGPAGAVVGAIHAADKNSRSQGSAGSSNNGGNASVIKNAAVGGVIAGPAGAVVGAIHAADKNQKSKQ